jgi:hypothetical protein
MSADLTHLDWQPVILLKVVRLPFGTLGGLSLKRAYIALHGERLLYADWTLEAVERTEALVCATGWKLAAPFHLPVRLNGKGAKVIPTGTWVLPYTDNLFTLYSSANAVLNQMIKHIDQHPTDPIIISKLIRLSQFL